MPNIEAVALQALSKTTFDTYWLDSLGSEASQPALELDIECDLLVVGGGFCTVSTTRNACSPWK
jgi:hypothetical protein